MDIICQSFAIIEVIVGVDDMIRFYAAVYIVIGAVLYEGESVWTGKLEACTPCGRQITNNAAAAAGGFAQQGDAPVFLEGPGNQVSTGEGRGRDEAVEVQAPACQSIVIIKLSVQIHIGYVGTGGLGSGEGVVYGYFSFAEEPANGISCRRCHAAAVAAQVKNHVFDRAVFPCDLPVGIDDDTDGVVRQSFGALIQCIVI